MSDAALRSAFLPAQSSSSPLPPPPYLSSLRAFLSRAVLSGHPLALVTSGGTTAPLEKSCVRFLDNFSTGTRGALLTEHLLRPPPPTPPYAVIFLTRAHSARPFRRRVHAALDTANVQIVGDAEVRVTDALLARDMAREQEARRRLLVLEFVTVAEYLLTLRGVAEELRGRAGGVMVVLAAAVSDFFVPEEELSEHKIQSQVGEGLQLRLEPVPKLLGAIKREWLPQAFVVSFKVSCATTRFAVRRLCLCCAADLTLYCVRGFDGCGVSWRRMRRFLSEKCGRRLASMASTSLWVMFLIRDMNMSP